MSQREREYVHVSPRPDSTACDVHAWTAVDFRKRLLAEMRARHGKGGSTCASTASVGRRLR
jgi:hypothetical protein